MLVLPTAKVLLYIALHLGPAHPAMVYATSNSESYTWQTTSVGTHAGWALEGKGFPASDFTRDPKQFLSFQGDEPTDSVPAAIREIAKYSWTRDTAYVFDNGDRIEKHGDHAFYILNAGGANEKVYTILFPSQGCSACSCCD